MREISTIPDRAKQGVSRPVPDARRTKMSEAHTRRKQPDVVRRALLQEAARIAANEGLAAVTIDSVAKAAGVTKGGLFHHFQSKQALIDGVMAEAIALLEEDVERRMEGDPEPYGRFTRAYVDCMFADLEREDARLWAAICASLMADASLRKTWSDWFTARLARHAETDGALEHAIARLAADGVWHASLYGMEAECGPDRNALRGRLIEMTRRPAMSENTSEDR